MENPSGDPGITGTVRNAEKKGGREEKPGCKGEGGLGKEEAEDCEQAGGEPGDGAAQEKRHGAL